MNKWPKRDVLKTFHYIYFIIYLIPLFPLRGNEVSTHQNYEITPSPQKKQQQQHKTKQNKTKQSNSNNNKKTSGLSQLSN